MFCFVFSYKRRRAPFASPQPSKKARTSDSDVSELEVALDEEGKRYKVPVSQGTEKVSDVYLLCCTSKNSAV